MLSGHQNFGFFLGHVILYSSTGDHTVYSVVVCVHVGGYMVLMSMMDSVFDMYC